MHGVHHRLARTHNLQRLRAAISVCLVSEQQMRSRHGVPMGIRQAGPSATKHRGARGPYNGSLSPSASCGKDAHCPEAPSRNMSPTDDRRHKEYTLRQASSVITCPHTVCASGTEIRDCTARENNPLTTSVPEFNRLSSAASIPHLAPGDGDTSLHAPDLQWMQPRQCVIWGRRMGHATTSCPVL